MIHALETPETLTEAEIFAADLIWRVSDPDKNTRMHSQGIRAMLSSVERFRGDSPLFKVMRGWFSPITFGFPLSSERIWENIIEMWTHLRPTLRPRGYWKSSLVEGLIRWLSILFSATARLWLQRVTGYKPLVHYGLQGNEMLQYVKAQVTDGEVHPALGMAKKAYLSCDEGTTDGEHLMLAWAFVQYKYIKMILEVLPASPETLPVNGRDIRIRIANLLRAPLFSALHGIPLPVSCTAVTLGGLTLTIGDVSDSWPNFERNH